MDGTIIQQGRFTSDGTAQKIALRSDVDWMEVINETQYATTQATGRGVTFTWQRGLSAGHAFEVTKADNTNVMQAEKVTSGGFTLVTGAASAAVTGTTITKASPPVCTAAGHGFSNGDTVILSNFTNMTNLSTITFTIGSVATNTFELDFFDTNTANFTQEAAFEVRKVPSFGWAGGWSIISSVTTGTTTGIQFTTNEAEELYEVGTVLKFSVSSAFAMTELDGLQGEITAYTAGTNTYTVDIDSSAFTAFAWPAPAALPFSAPVAVVVGSVNQGVSTDAVDNVSVLEIELGAGIDGPAGSTSDVVYWRAGKSFSVSNS